jgi:geranylgeranyl diphosphate synthase type II
LASGCDARPWITLGASLGEAYQVADDIRDVMGISSDLGKPAGQDALHTRPSAASELGLGGAVDYFQALIQRAVDSVPACTCRDMLQQLVRRESERLVPSAACAAYRTPGLQPVSALSA